MNQDLFNTPIPVEQRFLLHAALPPPHHYLRPFPRVSRTIRYAPLQLPMPALKELIERVKYPGLRLNHLYAE